MKKLLVFLFVMILPGLATALDDVELHTLKTDVLPYSKGIDVVFLYLPDNKTSKQMEEQLKFAEKLEADNFMRFFKSNAMMYVHRFPVLPAIVISYKAKVAYVIEKPMDNKQILRLMMQLIKKEFKALNKNI